MLQVDPAVQAALRTHQVGRVWGLATYQDDQVQLQLEQSGQVQFDGSAQVQSTSSVMAIGFGDSLVPKSKTDLLAAYGQEVSLFRDVLTARGDLLATIPLGVFHITRAGDAVERRRYFKQVDRWVTLDWSVSLDLDDMFEAIVADDFLAVETPAAGASVWAEIQRLSPIPVQSTLTDTVVPASTVYDTRIGALTTLIGLLGGEPKLTRSGVLTARQADAWMTATDAAFDIAGTITWSDEITNRFYNQVVVSSTNDPTLVAYRSLTDDSNPLSVNRAGGRTTKQSAPIYTTQAMVDAAAVTMLARVSTRRSRNVTVECTPEALLCELGDVGWVRDPVNQRAVFGEVTTMTFPLDPTQPIVLGLIVAEEA